MALIFLLSSDPQPTRVMPYWVEREVAKDLPSVQTGANAWRQLTIHEVAHPLEYGILGLLLARALAETGRGARLTAARLAAGLAIAVAYALLDEAHQFFVPGRSFQLTDLLLDGAGALAGLTLAWLWQQSRERAAGRTRAPS